ncbi:MAG: glutamate mutase L [Anaerolineales bacterium]|nr:glutamate mutase L [Anaerolineales bacterium]
MQQRQATQSILAADFGSVHTRVLLIDVVDGQYRLTTQTRVRTTIDPPFNDVTIGLGWALSHIQETTGRILVDEQSLIFPEHDDGSGVDELVATSSAPRPLTAVVLGLMPAVSISSAYRALTGTYINVAASLSASDQEDVETRINKILNAKPDLIFISGGTDGGNEEAVLELVRVASMAVTLAPPDEKPIVLYAGNQALADRVQAILDTSEAQVHIGKNVRPTMLREELGSTRLQLARSYSDHVVRQPGSFQTVAESGSMGVIPTAQGVENMVRWLGQENPRGVLHIDVGSTTSTLIVGTGTDVTTSIHTDLGLGHSILSTIERIDSDRINGWLPSTLTDAQLLEYAHNKLLVPDTIPFSSEELLIEQAIAREIVRVLAQDIRARLTQTGRIDLATCSPIIAAGAVLTDVPHPAMSAMLLADVLELQGITEIFTDPYAAFPILGAIAYTNQTAVVQTYDNYGLNYLGTLFSGEGRPRQGRGAAMKIRLQVDDGSVLEKRLAAGEMWSAPVTPGHHVTVTLRLGRGLRINGKRRIKMAVIAGTAGVIFDARGRPLPAIPMRRRNEVYADLWRSLSNGQVAYNPPPAKEEAPEDKIPESELSALQAFIEKTYDKQSAEEDKQTRGRRSQKSRKQSRRKGKDSPADDEPDWDALLK